MVNQDGVSTDPDKVAVVKEWPVPKSVKAVRSFLGFTGYYRRFIQNYSSLASPLTGLTKKGRKFLWGEDAQIAFEDLKEKLTSAPVLGYPNNTGQFILDTDASGCSIGAVISQVRDGIEKVIAYGSRKL